jgi:3D (Asp-Asp-Asp) domain-containing protein
MGRLLISCALSITASLAVATPNSLQVTATAFNSTVQQTDHKPYETACREDLEPGMKVVAVSRDLFKSGLACGTKIMIEGFQGEFTVLDKMNKRWQQRIDIYMDNDVARAKEWGARKVTIYRR